LLFSERSHSESDAAAGSSEDDGDDSAVDDDEDENDNYVKVFENGEICQLFFIFLFIYL